VGDWNDSSATTFKNAYNEFPWYTSGISGFVYAGDVARAMIALMKSDINEERFIITAENLPYREIFNMMAKYFSKKPPHRPASKFLAGIVWRIERLKSLFSGIDPLLTKETAETARMKVYFDSSKLKKFLPGFSYMSIDEAVAEKLQEYLLRVNR
jgi:nucleoside-diphosphate-sugar epimerase